MVKIVSDSTADIPAELAEALGITIVPCNVHFGLETYRDGLDLSKEEFYTKLKSSPTLPTTSAPATGLFEALAASIAVVWPQWDKSITIPRVFIREIRSSPRRLKPESVRSVHPSPTAFLRL